MSRSNTKTIGIPDKCKLIKGQKPLINYRFYLDIEKHHISSKIETKIKELGGVSIYLFIFFYLFTFSINGLWRVPFF